MNYEELIGFIGNEESGIAKGYDTAFLLYEKKEKVEKIIANDLKMFSKIETELAKNKKPIEGDYVCYDGKIAKISVIHHNGKIQLSNNIGVFVSMSGTQASGCTWDPEIDIQPNLTDLEKTNDVKKGKCWTFSGGQAGGKRGVYFEINFKVWNLK